MNFYLQAAFWDSFLNNFSDIFLGIYFFFLCHYSLFFLWWFGFFAIQLGHGAESLLKKKKKIEKREKGARTSSYGGSGGRSFEEGNPWRSPVFSNVELGIIFFYNWNVLVKWVILLDRSWSTCWYVISNFF